MAFLIALYCFLICTFCMLTSRNLLKLTKSHNSTSKSYNSTSKSHNSTSDHKLLYLPFWWFIFCDHNTETCSIHSTLTLTTLMFLRATLQSNETFYLHTCYNCSIHDALLKYWSMLCSKNVHAKLYGQIQSSYWSCSYYYANHASLYKDTTYYWPKEHHAKLYEQIQRSYWSCSY